MFRTLSTMLSGTSRKDLEIARLRRENLMLMEAHSRTLDMAEEAQTDAMHYKRTAITADNEAHAILDAVGSMLDQMEAHAGRGRLTKTAIKLYREEAAKLTGRTI